MSHLRPRRDRARGDTKRLSTLTMVTEHQRDASDESADCKQDRDNASEQLGAAVQQPVHCGEQIAGGATNAFWSRLERIDDRI